MALTSDGLTIKRFTEIVEDLNSGLKSNIGEDVDTSQNSLFGNIHSNFAFSLAELWELVQGVYDSQSYTMPKEKG